jgi:hypothetical protein
VSKYAVNDPKRAEELARDRDRESALVDGIVRKVETDAAETEDG